MFRRGTPKRRQLVAVGVPCAYDTNPATHLMRWPGDDTDEALCDEHTSLVSSGLAEIAVLTNLQEA